MHAFTNNLDKIEVGSKPAKIYVGIKFSELPFEEKQKLAAAAQCVVVQGSKKNPRLKYTTGSMEAALACSSVDNYFYMNK